MKNAHSGKILTHIFTVLLCVVVLLMLGCCFSPYYTVSEPYHFILNPNPMPDHYSLIDVMWTDTTVITTHFSEQYSNFNINNYVTNMVLSFIFAFGTLGTCVWHLANEMRKYPCMVSGVLTNICGFAWAIFSLMGYLNNQMLDLGVAKFMGIRNVIIALIFVGTVVVVARFVIWLLTEIKVSKERKARLAKL